VLGLYLDVTQADSFPSWPWIVALALTAVAAPFYAFHKAYTLLATTLAKAPQLILTIRNKSFLVANLGGKAEVTAMCVIHREYGRRQNWGPVPMIWNNSRSHKTTLLYQDSDYVWFADLKADGDDRHVAIRYYDADSPTAMIPLVSFKVGYEGRLGYCSIVLNSDPVWVGRDPEGQFNIEAIEGGNGIRLVSRPAHQELLDLWRTEGL